MQRWIGHNPALWEFTFYLQYLSIKTFLTSTLSTRGDENFTWDQGKKHIYDQNSWPFPAAIMEILDLQDQKLGRENAEEHCRGQLPPAVSRMDTCAPWNSLASSAPCTVNKPGCLLSIRRWQWQLAGLAPKIFCPRQHGLALSQYHPCSQSFCRDPHKQKGKTDWWIYSFQSSDPFVFLHWSLSKWECKFS